MSTQKQTSNSQLIVPFGSGVKLTNKKIKKTNPINIKVIRVGNLLDDV